MNKSLPLLVPAVEPVPVAVIFGPPHQSYSSQRLAQDKGNLQEPEGVLETFHSPKWPWLIVSSAMPGIKLHNRIPANISEVNVRFLTGLKVSNEYIMYSQTFSSYWIPMPCSECTAECREERVCIPFCFAVCNSFSGTTIGFCIIVCKKYYHISMFCVMLINCKNALSFSYFFKNYTLVIYFKLVKSLIFLIC